MGKPIIDDELWTLIEPLLSPAKPRRETHPGRLPVSNRASLTGILFVLKAGLRWRDLPAEMGCGSRVTCWRWLRDWQAAGMWDRLHELLLAKLRAADQIDFSRAAVDSSSIRAEVAVADLADAAALTRAFAGARGAYLVKPPNYALESLFEHADVTARAVAEAVRASGLPKLVLLSSVGADRAAGTGVIGTNRTAEQRLAELGIPVVFLRAAYFMENWARVVDPVRTQGILPSLLVPVERAIPMVATEDIGRIAANLLREDWAGIRKIGLEGPIAYSPADIAAILAHALNRPVRPVALELSAWAGVLAMNPFSSVAIDGFIELNRGLNSGYIDFGSDATVELRQGRVRFEQVAGEILRA